ncbi:MAG: YajQ family cyclic di-GMP-binding protein [Candidatus Kapabacteria bacterium]|nr:YajQ family cyclic di-GMP-binding protein [Candidatus Kapabacteria bacterium]
MSTYSFDFVSEVDLQEADNAINQAVKEIEHRYDLRGSNCVVELRRNDKVFQIRADGEHFVTAALEIVKQKMIKRGISVLSLDEQNVEHLSGKSVRQDVKLKAGFDREEAKKITTLIKDNKLKVTTQIIDEKVRVTGKSKDDLQTAIKLVQGAELGMPIQVDNLR